MPELEGSAWQSSWQARAAIPPLPARPRLPLPDPDSLSRSLQAPPARKAEGREGAGEEEEGRFEIEEGEVSSSSEEEEEGAGQCPAEKLRVARPPRTSLSSPNIMSRRRSPDPSHASSSPQQRARGRRRSLGREGLGLEQLERPSSLASLSSLPSLPRASLLGTLGGILKRGRSGSWKKPKLLDGASLRDLHALHADLHAPHSAPASHEGEEGRGAGGAELLLPLREVSEERANLIWECLKKHERWSTRTWAWVCAMGLLVGLAMLLNWFPARQMSVLVTLSPTINQAGRRRTLSRACAHLTRELVLDDGFARLSRRELAGALSFYLQELRRANDAVRLGGDLGIEVGADARNKDHNRIMYKDGCLWRADPADCTYALRPGVASKGLWHLALTFMDAVQSVLDRYAPPPDQWSQDFLTNPRREGLEEYSQVVVDAQRAERERLLNDDPDVAFILDNFDGDLFEGYAAITKLFDTELRDVVTVAMRDNQALFIIFVLLTFGGIYLMLFRNAVAEALREGERARTFVARIPAHTFSSLEVKTLCFLFQGKSPAHDDS